jgi:demethylmenaquinone methyltransferase/2-methoxy-6-polyprenyl-1,4-benzoquinol methylase
MSVLPPLAEKADYVEHMFARIAPRYDRMNRLMTLGQDLPWRTRAVALAAPPAYGRALDVGTGTGDFLPLLAAWMPRGFAVGVDFTLPMLRIGLDKLALERAAFAGGNALQLPFADAQFDVVTTGFVMRNVADLTAALREIYRVTKPGGRFACLETARPTSWFLRLGHWLYFELGVPLLGAAVGGDWRAYRYLPQSARVFPPPQALAEVLRSLGWRNVRYELRGGGAVAIHLARKPSEA